MTLKKIRLKELREETGLTQEQFAELLGVRQGNVSRIELQRYTPSITVLLDIVGALNKAGLKVTLDDLIEYDLDEGKMTARPANQPQLEATM